MEAGKPVFVWGGLLLLAFVVFALFLLVLLIFLLFLFFLSFLFVRDVIHENLFNLVRLSAFDSDYELLVFTDSGRTQVESYPVDVVLKFVLNPSCLSAKDVHTQHFARLHPNLRNRLLSWQNHVPEFLLYPKCWMYVIFLCIDYRFCVSIHYTDLKLLRNQHL